MPTNPPIPNHFAPPTVAKQENTTVKLDPPLLAPYAPPAHTAAARLHLAPFAQVRSSKNGDSTDTTELTLSTLVPSPLKRESTIRTRQPRHRFTCHALFAALALILVMMEAVQVYTTLPINACGVTQDPSQTRRRRG